MLKTTLKLLLIHIPVAKARVVIISVAEPAVIHDKHLYAALFCLACDSQKLFRIKIKICSLPVVYENRTLLILVRASYEVLPVNVMKITRHGAKS